ncbi:helix-turn-helix transcriptional regulator [Oxalobacteraceae bacterium CAVE-383]|nr:helix-turn-helix transcriptional regulator [Oxalobacteraceae bacterium CAVE-383]
MSAKLPADIFQSRLKEAISPENLKHWCARVGIPLSTLTGAAQRKTVPAGTTLIEIANAANCSIDWLLGLSEQPQARRGVPARMPEARPGQLQLPRVTKEQFIERRVVNTALMTPVARDAKDWSGFVQIPVYAMKAPEEHGAFIDEKNLKYMLAFREEFIRGQLQVSHNNLYCVEIKGISMEPLLRHGHPALIKPHSSETLREGPYLLRMEGYLMLKHVQRLPGGRLRIWSENQSTSAYQALEVEWPPAKGVDFQILGRVLWSDRIF